MILLAALILLNISYFIPYKIVDPEIAPYEEEYKNYVVKHCNEHQYFSHPIQKYIVVADLPADVIANCRSNNFTRMFITYNAKYWAMDRHDARMTTLFHEFTHCYFMEDHSPDSKNFMFAFENNLELKVVQNQLEDYLTKKCGK